MEIKMGRPKRAALFVYKLKNSNFVIASFRRMRGDLCTTQLRIGEHIVRIIVFLPGKNPEAHRRKVVG
ncbi:MAG: hypothetical protein ACLFQV_09675 [Vulcanimicrobiota bacterium]